KTAAEYHPSSGKETRKQENELDSLLPGPIQAGILLPEDQEGRDNHCTDGVPQPPRGPDSSICRPISKSAKGEGRDANRRAYGCADHSRKEGKFENILRSRESMLATRESAYQVAADHSFEGVSGSDADRSRHR